MWLRLDAPARLFGRTVEERASRIKRFAALDA
jgi:hypothetical protein